MGTKWDMEIYCGEYLRARSERNKTEGVTQMPSSYRHQGANLCSAEQKCGEHMTVGRHDQDDFTTSLMAE